MLIKDAYKKACEILMISGAEDAKSDARFLLSYYLGMPPAMIGVNGNREFDESGFFEWIQRRSQGEPCAYITGECEFMSLSFCIDKNVLVPRQDTETLCELAIEFCGDSHKKVLDICTGSGCIGISVAHYCKNAEVYGIDISESALSVANKNAKLNNTDVKFSHLDILNEIPCGEYDIILSNPPYIRSKVVDRLDSTVKDFEPRLALDGGDDGLVFYRRLADISRNILTDGGRLMLEIGYDQGDEVCNLLKEYNYNDVTLYYDIPGNPRVVCASINK